MSKREQAKIIMDELDKHYTIPTYMEEYAIKGIIAGLKRIEQEGDAEHGHGMCKD